MIDLTPVERETIILTSDLRLDRAAKLLGGTEEPVNFIMDSVGYRSRSLFYRDFTEKFGMAPGEYRKAAVAPRE